MRSARRLKTSLMRSSNLLSVSLAFRFSFMIAAALNVSACEFEGQQITCNHTVTYRDLVSSHEPGPNPLFRQDILVLSGLGRKEPRVPWKPNAQLSPNRLDCYVPKSAVAWDLGSHLGGWDSYIGSGFSFLRCRMSMGKRWTHTV